MAAIKMDSYPTSFDNSTRGFSGRQIDTANRDLFALIQLSKEGYLKTIFPIAGSEQEQKLLQEYLSKLFHSNLWKRIRLRFPTRIFKSNPRIDRSNT